MNLSEYEIKKNMLNNVNIVQEILIFYMKKILLASPVVIT